VRVAILGMGAIGHVVARALEGRAELVEVDRTKAPLRPGEPPVEAAVVATKTPGTEWAANVAAKIIAPDGVALTVQNGLGNYEILADHVGHERVTAGVIYVGAAMVDGRLRATGPGKIELGRPEPIRLKRSERHTIEAVVDRLVVHDGIRARLTDSIETALKWGGNKLAILRSGRDASPRRPRPRSAGGSLRHDVTVCPLSRLGTQRWTPWCIAPRT